MKRLAALALFLCVLCGWALAEKTTVSVAFPDTMDGLEHAVETELDFDWFDEPSDQYDHRLAKLSISVAMSAFRDGKVPLSEADHYLLRFFDEAGFDSYETYGYEKRPTRESVSNGIGIKYLSDEAGEYVLLAVPVCGQGYGDEWLGNFTVDHGTEHVGFAIAADTVYERVLNYIEHNDLSDKRVKVWCMGFSRAAAVSNLLGDRLLRDGCFAQTDIFVYTFGTPNTTKEPTAWPQIHNICGRFDPVPRIPFGDWGFGKHGETFYLPAMETETDFLANADGARTVFSTVLGSDENFKPMVERNWLVCRIMEMLYACIPDAEAYTAGYQNAVIAAWSAKGSPLNKIDAMMSQLVIQGEDTAALEQVRDELIMLVSVGVTDTVNLLIGKGGTSVWFELLSSGKLLAHEHFPEVYLSWLYSTDDLDVLFGRGDGYVRLIYTGNPAVTITDGENVLLDETHSEMAVTHVKDQTFVFLPVGKTYHVNLRADTPLGTQLGYGRASVAKVSLPLMTTNAITLYENEFISMEIPTDQPDGMPIIQLNNEQEIALFDGADGGTYAKLLVDSSGGATEEMRYMMNSAVIMVPWILCSTILLLYLIVVFIKRLIRHHLDDAVHCRRAGKAMLIAAAVLSGLAGANVLFVMIRSVISAGTVVLTNRTLLRASQFLGWSTNIYLSSQMIIYAITALLCLRSIHHELSRIRLVRVSLALIVLDVITLFLGRVFGTLNLSEFFVLVVPVLNIAGVLMAMSREDRGRAVGRRWLPVTRVLLITALIFFARQGYVFIFGVQNPIAVGAKALSGLPVLLLALELWHRRREMLNRLTLWAMICYFAANTVINLSMPLGIAAFIVGHVLLIFAYQGKRRFTGRQLVFWGALTAVGAWQIFQTLRTMGAVEQVAGFFYAAALSGMLVSAWGTTRRLRTGTIIYLMSNLLLSVTLLFPGDFVLESVELLLYYIALLILAADPKALLSDETPEAVPDGGASAA